MTRRWMAVATLAWRESRNSRRRLLLFVSSISIGVAALVAIDSYSANVTRSIAQQSRALLGADLSLVSRQPLTEQIERQLDSLVAQGAAVGRITTFASMAVLQRSEATRLVQVRAVTAEVPFYGQIRTDPASAWGQLRDGQHALVDESLLIGLGAEVGDTIGIGFSRFRITGLLVDVPGDIGVASALGPRVYISDAHLFATGLIGFGSRAEYEAILRLPEEMSARRIASDLRPVLEEGRARARTVADTERELTAAIGQLNRFLGLVGLIALLLGGIGVASAVHAYVAEKVGTVAVLRCVGASSGQTLGIYLLEAAALGLFGASLGAALGVAIQFALPGVLGEFVPVDVALRLEPRAILAGLGVGLWVAVIFAAPPLLAVRRISPLQTLRRDVEHERVGTRLDLPRAIAASVLAGSVLGIVAMRAGNMREAAVMSLAIGAAVLVLWLAATVLSGAARRVLRDGWTFTIRQGVANLYRPANQTRAVILSLGFGAFLISTLFLVQANLLRQLSLSGEATRANMAFFDVQEDQVEELDSLIRSAGQPVLQRVPIVPMRVASINGRDVTELSRGRASWALRREYRSSYRDTLVASERLVAGRWFASSSTPNSLHEISVERDLAAELGVSVGDSITWDVQGVRVSTLVASLREVNWARFEPNFFVVFVPEALRRAPQTWVFLTHAEDPGQRARLQHAAVDRFPNVSSIDLSLIQQAVGGILDRVTVAVRFMALFSIVTGALVLFSSVAATRRQRLREGVLLKTLGATRAQIGRIMLSEYALLGLLGSATGMLLSIAGAWALMHFVFESSFALAALPLFALGTGMAVLTLLIGVLGSRDVFSETPMAALREG